MLPPAYTQAFSNYWFSHAEEGLVLFNPENNCIEAVNSTFAKLYGYTPEELIGEKVEFLFACDRKDIKQNRFATLHTFDNISFETIHPKKNKTPVRVSVKIITIENSIKNQPLRMAIVSSIESCSNKKCVFQDTNSKLQGIFCTIPDLVWMKDPEGKYIASNPTFQKIFGKNECEVLGKTDFDFFTLEEAQACSISDKNALMAESIYQCQESFISPDNGEKAILEVRKSRVLDIDGNLLGILGIGRDITERLAYEEKLSTQEKNFRTLAENSIDNIMRYDKSAKITYANPQAERSLGVRLEEIKGKTPRELFSNNNRDELERILKNVIATGESNQAYITIQKPSGEEANYFIQIVAEKDEKSNTTGALAFGRDVTVLTQRTKDLEKALEFNESIIHAIPDLLFEVDLDGNYLNFWSHDENLLNKYKTKLIGRNVRDILNENSASTVKKAIEEANKKGVSYGKIYNIITSNQERWFELSISKRGEGKFIALARDITERKNIEERIAHMAHHDPITGLPNRLLLQQLALDTLNNTSSNGQKVAFFFIDLDGFKTINDSLGHALGDLILKDVAIRLQRCLRPDCSVSRYGGDEFIIIIPHIKDEAEAEKFATTILEKFQLDFTIHNQLLFISASIGVSLYPDHGDSFDQLLQNADAAMFQAKEKGKNTYSLFTSQMGSDMSGLFQMQKELKEAIKNQEFVLHYQPQIDLTQNKIIGAEALIRWNHPTMGTVPPMHFIPVAEACGYIVEIGEWVLNEACRQAAVWNANGKDIVIAVNVSAVQFRRGNLIDIVKNALSTSGLNPKYLELELTESILINDTEKILQVVKAIKELGVQLSIDDFGTGYSSLAYLKRFAVDKLKIDQSFVKEMIYDKENASIVKTIIQMAKSFNLRAIAEGVEDNKILEALKVLECDEVQGYHFARPMEAEEFKGYFRRIRMSGSED